MGTQQNTLVIITTAIVGLGMLWAKLAEIQVNRKNKEQVDQTVIEGKEIDSEVAWRNNLVTENQNLHAELRQMMGNYSALSASFQAGVGELRTIANEVKTIHEKQDKLQQAYDVTEKTLRGIVASLKNLVARKEVP
jgi:seryl-tRNA synthetase